MKRTDEKNIKIVEISNQSYEVYLDFVFEAGLFYIVIKNNSNSPVFKVHVKFSNRMLGVDGKKEITSINLFKNIEFLAPQKEIKTFLDTSESYFSRKQPTKIVTEIVYTDIHSKNHKVVIKHDLEIYRDIGFIIKNNN